MRLPRPSYANVASTLALLIALGGTSAFAASKLAPRSVGEPQLRPGAVTAQKLRKSAVTAPKIKPGAVQQGKLAAGAVTAPKLAPDAIGTATLIDGAVTNPKIAPDAVTGEKALESTFSQVPSAARADFATAAETANPPAFAAVTPEATLNPSFSKGIASVSEGSLGGIYCVAAQGFTPRGAQVTPRFTGSGQVSAYARIGGTEECPAPQVEVQTFEAGVRLKQPFYIALYR